MGKNIETSGWESIFIVWQDQTIHFEYLPWETGSILLDRLSVFIQALDRGATVERAHCLSRCLQNKALYGAGYGPELEAELKEYWSVGWSDLVIL